MDINWHYPDDDGFDDVLFSRLNAAIVVETDVCYRISNVENCDRWSYQMTECEEQLKRFAFLEH